MVKKLSSFVLAILLFFSLNIDVFSSNANVKTKDTIKIGYVQGYGGINDLNAVIGKGYLYDMFKRMEVYSDYTFDFIKYEDFDALASGIKNKEFDYFGPVIKTNKSEDNKYNCVLKLSDAVISLVAKKDGTEYFYDDPQNIDGKTVACYKNNVIVPYLDAYCKHHNISVEYVYGDEDNYEKLDADFFLTTSNYSKFSEYTPLINLANFTLYVASTSNNDALNKNILHAYYSMIACDATFLNDLNSQYFADVSSQRRGLTRKEASMFKNQTFKIAFDSGHDFFSYINEDGEPDGFFVNLASDVMSRTGAKKVEFLPYTYDGKGKNSVKYAVENADVVITSKGKYKDFRYDFTLTDTYLNIPYTLLVDKELYYSNDKTPKAEIGIVRNMFMSPDSTDGIPFDATFKVYDNVSQLYSDYNSNKIDGFFIAECAMCLAKQNIERNYYTIATNASIPYKLWISNKLGSEYVTIANVVFDQVDMDNAYELIIKEQEKYKYTPSFMETIKTHLPEFAFFISIIIVAVMLIIIFMQKSKQKKIKTILEVDELTGLMTRYKFIKKVQNRLKSAKPNEYMIMALDVDNFKNFNKTYGTNKGDELLHAIGEIMHENSNEFIYICRFENDNFVMLLRNKLNKFTDIKQLKKYNENLEKNINKKLQQKINELDFDSNIYFSSGIYVIEDLTDELNFMIDCAFIAKNVGKNQFGNTTILFTQEIKNKMYKEYEILNSMEKAIKNEEFFILIQPKVALETEKIIGGEVLVRWEKEDCTLIYPDEFIPLFEKNNFIVKLDHYVLEKACKFIYNTKVDLPIISVNVSAATCLQNNFIDSYMEVLRKYSILPQQLELELTESVLDANYLEVLSVIEKLKQLGFGIAIDDFGKGASSLARIRELDVDVLKLDKEFIDDNVSNEKGRLVLYNVIAMASDLGILTLAEGVETEEQRKMLVELGCELAQGYYFDKPLSLENLIDRISKSNSNTFEFVKNNKRVSRYWNQGL